MSRVFLDTSYLIALLVADDAHHASAVALQKARSVPLLTTEYVLIELADALARAARDLVNPAIQALYSDAAVAIVPASTKLMSEALSLYGTRSDKHWGLTDCISFVVMRQNGVAEALTSDRHFEQAGFKALLRQA